jgi:hypothetical protein
MHRKVCHYVLMVYSVRLACHPSELSKLISARELRPVLGESAKKTWRKTWRKATSFPGSLQSRGHAIDQACRPAGEIAREQSLQASGNLVYVH